MIQYTIIKYLIISFSATYLKSNKEKYMNKTPKINEDIK